MITPSIKTLSTIFGENAKLAKFFLNCSRDELLDCSLSASDLQRSSWGKHSAEYLRLIACNEIGRFHGVECIECDNGKHEGQWVYYLNAGDAYCGTLILWRGRWRVTTLGDFVETMGRRGVRFK